MQNNHVEILSNIDLGRFNDSWYELATEDHFWMQWRLRILQKIAGNKLNLWDKEISCLDIGCGEGVLRAQLEKVTPWHIDGCDINYDTLKAIPAAKGKTFLYDIYDRNPALKEKYDVILLCDVLEHIEDTKGFLDACLFHIKKDGYVLINVPALESMRSVYDDAVGHIRRYDKKMMQEELQQHKVEVIDMRYWGFFLVPILSIRKVILNKFTKKEDVVKKGFRPPGRLVNSLFKFGMMIETSLFSKPFTGSSLTACIKKK